MALAADRHDDRQDRFRRFGLGYQYQPPEAPVVMTFTSVSEKRGEVRAEVHVQTVNGGHMLRRYINLLGSSSAGQLVKDLAAADGGAGFPWAKILESATESIIRAIRIGPELETYRGVMNRPPGISWLCEGLVMANVPNVWLAAGSTGKSTFAVALCVCHAAGYRFLERDTTRGIPLYLDWESTAEDFQEKVWLVSRWLGLREVPRVHRLEMRGPATMYAAPIANRIDGLGATLVVWDGVQAAGGPIGQYTNYESVAMDLEALVGLLPKTTHVLLDHVTGDDLKGGAVPLKARGATRKVEWARNQWSLVLDREAQQSRRHVVGWTHTKINRAEYLPAFGVEVLHRPDELGFSLLDEEEVAPLKEKMPQWRQLLAVVQQAGHPLTVHAAAELWLGRTDKKATDLTRALVNRYTRAFTKNADGMFEPHWSTVRQPTQSGRAGATGTTAASDARAELPTDWPEQPEQWPEQMDDDGIPDLPF